ncbi:hypothetical protein RFI_14069 [Reticulomyxa filosa]|uniref:PH domain-containing protein n=1 Tax=Reticulomyxa filosa TaxID=46433 RepID=X6NAP9_RETFI|nr:hypothetical protein RFI_14069 [Reticulomyxa filosa]|eukprot:ETO23116.1 hypothetical protein RFI_14069 [Reticulomyxa filosa]
MGQIWKKRWLTVRKMYLLWSTTAQDLTDPSNVQERRKKFCNSITLLQIKKAIKVNSTNSRKFNVVLFDKTYNFRAPTKEARDHWVSGLTLHLEAVNASMKWLKSDTFASSFVKDETSYLFENAITQLVRQYSFITKQNFSLSCHHPKGKLDSKYVLGFLVCERAVTTSFLQSLRENMTCPKSTFVLTSGNGRTENVVPATEKSSRVVEHKKCHCVSDAHETEYVQSLKCSPSQPDSPSSGDPRSEPEVLREYEKEMSTQTDLVAANLTVPCLAADIVKLENARRVMDSFEIIRSLGEGISSTVFEVKHISSARRYALKRLRVIYVHVLMRKHLVCIVCKKKKRVPTHSELLFLGECKFLNALKSQGVIRYVYKLFRIDLNSKERTDEWDNDI